MTISDTGRAAQALPSLILSTGISERDFVRVGQRAQGLSLIVYANVAISQSQIDVRMTAAWLRSDCRA
jgi:hypothetical protein